jgi:hypothetical protein
MTENTHQQETDRDQKKREEMKDNFIAVYTTVLTFFFTAFAIFTYYQNYDSIIKLLIYVSCSGALGGLVYSIFGYTKYHKQKEFKPEYFWWYFFRPIIATILAAIAFFFVAGGLMTLSGIDVESLATKVYPMKTVMFYSALAFLTGYSTNSFIKKINELAGIIFEKTEDTPTNGNNPNGSSGTELPKNNGE